MVTLGLGVADGSRGITSISVFNQHLRSGRIYEVRRLRGHDDDDDDGCSDDGDGRSDDDDAE